MEEGEEENGCSERGLSAGEKKPTMAGRSISGSSDETEVGDMPAHKPSSDLEAQTSA